MSIGRIVCGGQSGVDRAALDVAIALGVCYGGWCPRGGWAEDMPEPPGLLVSYPELDETPAADPEQRTRWNVRDSDATLILTAPQVVSAGTALTLAAAMELGRELAVIDVARPEPGLRDSLDLLAALPGDGSLNVAGPRESEAPGIYEATVMVLASLLESA
ncbi:MAG TPA: putative molybdenum carrier protein [Solirubrobacteraceae bacterium]